MATEVAIEAAIETREKEVTEVGSVVELEVAEEDSLKMTLLDQLEIIIEIEKTETMTKVATEMIELDSLLEWLPEEEN